jgi:hypothetical protein
MSPTLSAEQSAVGRDAVGRNVPAQQGNQVGRDRDRTDRLSGALLEPAFVVRLSAVGPRGSRPGAGLPWAQSAPAAPGQLAILYAEPDDLGWPCRHVVHAPEERHQAAPPGALRAHGIEQRESLPRIGHTGGVQLLFHLLRGFPLDLGKRVVRQAACVDRVAQGVVEDGALPADGRRGCRGAVQLLGQCVERVYPVGWLNGPLAQRNTISKIRRQLPIVLLRTTKRVSHVASFASFL